MGGFDLDRFVAAQDADGTFERAVSELRNGRKRSHWMWFIFPQIAGLGQSATSQRYAISSLEEARAYLQHPVLGPRLLDCARIIAATGGSSAEQILGGIDAQKLHSSMTLFAQAAPHDVTFAAVLDRFFGGEPDQATMGLLHVGRDDQIPTAPAGPHDQPAGNGPINPA
jgi:uncharacterized protein (DUF1810 family)